MEAIRIKNYGPNPDLLLLQVDSLADVSDGYHTLEELYEHRHLLFLALCKALNDNIAWKSELHHDGSYLKDWFIVGLNLDGKDITYHMPMRLWDLAEKTGVPTVDRAPEWDGHTPADVLQRLREWIEL
jgi:hypothetical protein